MQAGTNTLASYTYAANNGKLQTLTYGNGLVVKYIYDVLDRISAIQYNTGEGGAFETVYEYVYTSAGQIYSVVDYDSNEKHIYTYDNRGKKIRSYVVNLTGNDISYSDTVFYDEQERVTKFLQLFSYGTASDTVETHYGYNVRGEMDIYLYISEGLGLDVLYTYDNFGRATRKESIYSAGARYVHTQNQHTSYLVVNGKQTGLVSQVTIDIYYNGVTPSPDSLIDSITYQFSYDASGNIVSIVCNDVVYYSYEYDDIGQLVREDNRPLGKTFVYEYDNAGNITKKTEYAYTEGSLDGVTPVSTVTYTYGNESWGDQLTNINGTNLTYDAIGNLVGIGSTTLTWQGRELQSYGNIATYTYNADGIRTSKTVNDVKHTYVLYGSQILAEYWADNVLLYIYDELNTPVALKYRNTTYAEGMYDCFFFEKNFLGDIVAIYDENGVKLGTYNYDAWGNFTIVNGSATVGTFAYDILHTYNPFRYRGYYYDVETGLYYLQSRYYNAEWGRFISSDGVISGVGGKLLGNNQYAYCFNNPISLTDANGNWPSFVNRIIKSAAQVITKVRSIVEVPLTAVKIAAASTIAVATGSATIEDIKEDISNYSFFNSDEQKVIDSNVFSSYNGTLVIKHDMEIGGQNINSFSIANTIMLEKGTTSSDTVRHEWGHTVQETLMGPLNYVRKIAIPSVIGCIRNPSSKTYYSFPWERSADYFGGVENRSTGYNEGSEIFSNVYFLLP